MSGQGQFQTRLNPWTARARKFLVTAATAVVILGNTWADGPEWLSPVAAGLGALLMYWVPNAPKYVDPRPKR